MTRASEDSMSNLETGNVAKRHSTGCLGDLMKMWIALDMGFEKADLPSKCRVIDAANDCPKTSMEEPTSNTIQIIGSPAT
jgi:hypothetical protein